MNRYATPLRILILLFVTLMAAGFTPAWASETESEYTPEDCIECHQTGSEDSQLHISVQEFNDSAHGEETTCLDCHTGVVDDDHQGIEGSGAVYCGQCHEQENRHGGIGLDVERPNCYDCHSKHNILDKTDPASTVHRDRLPDTCGECHPVASGQNKGWFAWFPSFQVASHNKADFSTSFDKDNCLGCHQGAGAHGETEPIDEQQTCYKCHSPALDSAMWGLMHPDASAQMQPGVFAAGVIYQIFIVIALVIGGFYFMKRS